jgi:transcriptional regulator with XRE-family HTH domain
MQQLQNGSNRVPDAGTPPAGRSARDVRWLVFEAARRAEAMGLMDPEATLQEERTVLRQLATRARRAGIAAAAADQLSNVERPDPAEIAPLLETLIAALEASPVPKFEWAGLGRVFAPEELARLINVSVSSLKRYMSGERDTPDGVAARLHFLALLVGDLAGSYNSIGVRRWFQRKRTRLGGRAPAAILKGNWDPDDAAPMRVRQLAAELVSLSAT